MFGADDEDLAIYRKIVAIVHYVALSLLRADIHS
jgi:hypothetical protein